MFDAVQLLERAPDGVRRFAYRVAAGEGVAGRFADRLRFRFDASEIPALPPVATQPVRVIIGPANSAGQAFRWARALEKSRVDVRAIAMQGIGSSPFRPEVDLRVPVAVYQRSTVWHERLEALLSRQTHAIWESGWPLMGRGLGSDPVAEMRWAADRGVEPALLFHGSDIRPPADHAGRNIWSPFHESAGPVHALEATTARNAELARASGVPVFVATPDLLEWVPTATWVPVVVDAEVWQSSVPALGGRRPPVVVHAPTQRWMKGTDLIEPMLRRLAAEGVIEYRQLVGVPHAAMPEFFGSADVVLDQFRLGSYGVAACEALAAGRLVMGHIDATTRERVNSETGLDLPIHEATIDSLEGELRRAAAEPAAFGDFRSAGPAFVAAVHDGRRSAAAFEPFLRVSA